MIVKDVESSLQKARLLLLANLATDKDQSLNTRRLNLAGNYMFKVNNRNIKTRCEICSKLTINSFLLTYLTYLYFYCIFNITYLVNLFNVSL